jgi:hypothetical protein
MTATFEELTAAIVEQALTCARQTDKWRAPYAAIVSPCGNREFIKSVGRNRTVLESEDAEERATLLARIQSLRPGFRVETRDMRYCTHKREVRDCWTRIETGWKHEQISGKNRHGY